MAPRQRGPHNTPDASSGRHPCVQWRAADVTFAVAFRSVLAGCFVAPGGWRQPHRHGPGHSAVHFKPVHPDLERY